VFKNLLSLSVHRSFLIHFFIPNRFATSFKDKIFFFNAAWFLSKLPYTISARDSAHSLLSLPYAKDCVTRSLRRCHETIKDEDILPVFTNILSKHFKNKFNNFGMTPCDSPKEDTRNIKPRFCTDGVISSVSKQLIPYKSITLKTQKLSFVK
jgi:hypothetical protein